MKVFFYYDLEIKVFEAKTFYFQIQFTLYTKQKVAIMLGDGIFNIDVESVLL